MVVNVLRTHAYCEDPDIILCGNKSDLEDKRVVSEHKARELAEKHGVNCKVPAKIQITEKDKESECAILLSLVYLETSAATGQNVARAVEILLDRVMRRMETSVDKSLLPHQRLKNTGQLDEIAYYQFEARDDRARKRINRRFLIKAIQAKCSSLTAQTLSRTQFTVPIGEEQAAKRRFRIFFRKISKRRKLEKKQNRSIMAGLRFSEIGAVQATLLPLIAPTSCVTNQTIRFYEKMEVKLQQINKLDYASVSFCNFVADTVFYPKTWQMLRILEIKVESKLTMIENLETGRWYESVKDMLWEDFRRLKKEAFVRNWRTGQSGFRGRQRFDERLKAAFGQRPGTRLMVDYQNNSDRS
ncbi:Ras-related protein Rab-27A [Melipona quadrifasciata]|uniref:Ras-related protein Rab-27A n=1 Tax=Melipona quadrifasciata TaxID=166423 RepID=A0A0M9A2U3_9HYME|nr:Ras-related protein Rab-27A [Melipona quadrifasciata]